MDLVDRIKAAMSILLTGKLSSEEEVFLNKLSDSVEVPEELAISILMVDLSLIDKHFDVREYDFIYNFLETYFGLNGEQINKLIKHASHSIQNLKGAYTYAVRLRERLSPGARRRLVSMLKELMVADGKDDGFEIHLINKIEDLLTAEIH